MERNAGAPAEDQDVDQSSLDALRENLATVLGQEADGLQLHGYIDGRNDLEQRLWSMAAELGWLAVGLPEDYGGLGLGVRGLHLLHEQLGRRAAPGPFIATLAAAQTLLETADEATKGDWLPRIAVGECSLAIPGVIGGGGPASEAWLLGAQDAAAALVPGADGGWDLVALDGAGVEPVNTWDLTRRVLRVAPSGRTRIARIADGAAVEASLRRHLAVALASDSTGASRGILEQTIDYMKERRQFDRTIASFQALKHRAADLMTQVISGEEIMELAVGAVARNRPDADAWAMLAKARQTDAYVQLATECLQLHGGVGFTWEFDAHIHLKRARLNQVLGVPNAEARDAAANRLADAARAGRSVLELA